MVINVGDSVYTPRFCNVRIEEVFPSEEDLINAGYTEPTHYRSSEYAIRGKSIGVNQMVFAAAFKR